MFNPLKGLGDLRQLQQSAQKMQEALKQESLSTEKDGVLVKIRGDQHIIEVSIDGTVDARVAEAINEAIAQTQKLAAKKLLELSK